MLERLLKSDDLPVSGENAPFLLPGGREIAVTVQRNPRAKRVILRLAPFEDGVVVVLPRGVGVKEGLSFLRSKAGWVEEKLAVRPDTVPFADGAVLPFRGERLTIYHRPELRGSLLEDGITGKDLLVGGHEAHVARRVRDWLKARAMEELSAHARPMAAQLNRSISRITLRDPRTRWGSCSSDGSLSFSWRLILAPPEVLHYVAAHEVAHLEEANHSSAFWTVVTRLFGDAGEEKKWLRENGRSLHRYGAPR